MEFGKILRELRQEKDLSQVQLAKITGIGKSTISDWELSRKEPTASSLIKLADFFNISIDELLGRKDYI
ncbi:MAG: helix-turn-helix domain-containing protein [Firmicutes bacterium]|nr:helix-turn-helix domain-containing protein [Bacillota bacterium]